MKNSSRMQAIRPSIVDGELLSIVETSTNSSVKALRRTHSSSLIPKAISGLTTVPYKAAEIDAKLPFLKAYGNNSLAYSSLQEGLDYYLLANCGYIAYSLIGNTVPLCLADPICSISDTQELLKHFLAKYTHPMFFHVSKDVPVFSARLAFQ